AELTKNSGDPMYRLALQTAACVFAVVSCLSRAEARSLTLTPAATARGFSLSLFADGWGSVSIGPLGIAFPKSGGVIVSDFQGNVRVFPTNSDGQHANLIKPVTYGFVTADLDVVGDRIFMAVNTGPRGVVELNPDGTTKQTIVATPGQVYGLIAN